MAWFRSPKQFSSDGPAVTLRRMRVASPCPARWEEMIGDDRTRHCSECNLNVYNFSAMTEREIKRVVSANSGRLCARFYRRADGTMLTQDCPRGLRAVGRRISRITAAAVSALMSVGFATAAPKSQQHHEQQQAESHANAPGIWLTVVDPQGALITNAKINLLDRKGKAVAQGFTNSTGEYSLTNLHSGDYILTISAQGFRDVKVKIPFDHGKLLQAHIKLPVKDVETVVGVVSEPPIVQGTVGVIEVYENRSLPSADAHGGLRSPLRQ